MWKVIVYSLTIPKHIVMVVVKMEFRPVSRLTYVDSGSLDVLLLRVVLCKTILRKLTCEMWDYFEADISPLLWQ